LIRGINRISTNMPLSPTIYFSQKVIKFSKVWYSTWLSTASVHFNLVVSGSVSPG